jgi:hypothetical protein
MDTADVFDSFCLFPSSGYLTHQQCPFFQHGLCHRPYCHFKHAKQAALPTKPLVQPAVQQKTVVKKGRAESEVNHDDMMRIIRNVPTTSKNAQEIAKQREQEQQDLSRMLAVIDDENKQKLEKSTTGKKHESEENEQLRQLLARIDGENKMLSEKVRMIESALHKTGKVEDSEELSCLNSPEMGLTDKFYGKPPPAKIETRKVCLCDDPDCTGFIEEEDNKSALVTESKLSKTIKVENKPDISNLSTPVSDAHKISASLVKKEG